MPQRYSDSPIQVTQTALPNELPIGHLGVAETTVPSAPVPGAPPHALHSPAVSSVSDTSHDERLDRSDSAIKRFRHNPYDRHSSSTEVRRWTPSETTPINAAPSRGPQFTLPPPLSPNVTLDSVYSASGEMISTPASAAGEAISSVTPWTDSPESRRTKDIATLRDGVEQFRMELQVHAVAPWMKDHLTLNHDVPCNQFYETHSVSCLRVRFMVLRDFPDEYSRIVDFELAGQFQELLRQLGYFLFSYRDTDPRGTTMEPVIGVNDTRFCLQPPHTLEPLAAEEAAFQQDLRLLLPAGFQLRRYIFDVAFHYVRAAPLRLFHAISPSHLAVARKYDCPGRLDRCASTARSLITELIDYVTTRNPAVHACYAGSAVRRCVYLSLICLRGHFHDAHDAEATFPHMQPWQISMPVVLGLMPNQFLKKKKSEE